jgi:hypothetical protein
MNDTKEWIWMRDVKNQYVFHLHFKDSTHQLSFDKRLYSRAWVRKRKIMKFLGDGDVTVSYNVFKKDYLSAIYSTTKKVDVKDVKKLFGGVIYDKILSLS